MGGIYAQHMTFKGVPIDGTLKDYTEAMKKVGFNHEKTDDGVAVLSGDFAGYKNCTIDVSTLTNCDIVSKITVKFPTNTVWSDLMKDYENLKTLLTKKYGRPKECQEKFTRDVSDRGDSKLMALYRKEYEWYTKYETNLGSIMLTISSGILPYTGYAVLIYQDKINGEKVINSALDDL